MNLAQRMIPRDVRTRWNSTSEMLDVAWEYRAALQRLCGDMQNGLRDYEISDEEWTLVKHLRKILKVRMPAACACIAYAFLVLLDSQRCVTALCSA